MTKHTFLWHLKYQRQNDFFRFLNERTLAITTKKKKYNIINIEITKQKHTHIHTISSTDIIDLKPNIHRRFEYDVCQIWSRNSTHTHARTWFGWFGCKHTGEKGNDTEKQKQPLSSDRWDMKLRKIKRNKFFALNRAISTHIYSQYINISFFCCCVFLHGQILTENKHLDCFYDLNRFSSDSFKRNRVVLCLSVCLDVRECDFKDGPLLTWQLRPLFSFSIPLLFIHLLFASNK